jgi:long-subunit fatty acid transport protein
MPSNPPIDLIDKIQQKYFGSSAALAARASSVQLRILFLLTVVVVMLAFPETSRAQGLEINGGWSHVTGDFGTNGFEVGAAWWFTHRVTMAANYDSDWNDSNLGIFAFTSVGAIAVNSHYQQFVIGPRIFFTTDWTDRHRLNPFGEAQFGFSHLAQTVKQDDLPRVGASDTAFTWLLGGGAEYLITPHWSARGNLDFDRTHFANAGQSRLRLVLGVAYTFGSRRRPPKSKK